MSRLASLFEHNRKSLAGGFAITVLGLGGALLVGETSGYEAEQLLDRTVPNLNMLCNTIILASATILTLLLTLLGFTSNAEATFKRAFYARIQQVALFDAILFVTTMFLFLLLNFPVAQSESLPAIWFQSVYYTTLVATSVVGGMIVVVILLLYQTTSDLIQIMGYGKSDHYMLDIDEEAEEQDAEADPTDGRQGA